MEQLEGIPRQGDWFTYENLTITATQTDDHRVELATVKVGKKEPTQEQETAVKKA